METRNRMRADALKDLARMGEQLDVESVAGADQAGEDGGSPPAAVAPKEEPVLPSDDDSPQTLLRADAVDLQVSALALGDEDFAVSQRPTDAQIESLLPRQTP